MYQSLEYIFHSHQLNRLWHQTFDVRFAPKALISDYYLTSLHAIKYIQGYERKRAEESETQGAVGNSTEVCLCVSRPHHSTKTHEFFISQFSLFWMQVKKADHTEHPYIPSTLIWEENSLAQYRVMERLGEIICTHRFEAFWERTHTHLYTRVVEINSSQEGLVEPLTIQL